MADVKLLKLSGGDLKQHDETADDITFNTVTVGSTGPLLKDNSGTLDVRNNGDSAYADIHCLDCTVDGDLTVNGTTTYLNTTNTDITDVNVTLNKGGNEASADDAAGITVEMSDATDGSILYDSDAASFWKVGQAGSEVEVADISTAQTLTNKSIDADNNTLSNIETDNAKSSALTGSDTQFVTGTAGTSGNLVEWDANGDAVDSGVASGDFITFPSYTAGAGGIAQYDAVYISANDTVLKADADAIGTARVIGFAPNAISAASSGTIQTSGLITGIGSAWTAGAPVYLSTTAGALTQTAPSGSGDVIVEVGIAKNATDLQINIMKHIILD